MNKLSAFTLIELLFVIGLLGLIATLIIPQLSGTKTDAIEPIIQSELTEIQRAFFRFKNDYNLQKKDYNTIAELGTDILITKPDTFELWDPDRQRGWKGPYLNSEHTQSIDTSHYGQPAGGTIEIHVVLTPDNSNYYHIIATDKNNDVLSQNNSNKIHQLWLLYPHQNINNITTIPESNDSNRKYYRKLLAEVE
jgi:type II secretory pathway pseudopilin PulG